MHLYGLGEYIVEHTKLIAHIWNGDIALEDASKVSPLTGLLGSLLNIPVITVSCNAELAKPFALLESDEIVPGASLGDVLSEELSVDVPYGALVLVQPQEFSRQRDYTSAELGEILGGVILDMAQQNQIAVTQEEQEQSGQFNVSGSVANLDQRAQALAARLQ